MTSTHTRLLAGFSGLVGLALALPAAAHEGVGAHADAVSAFLHPFTGVDHLLVLFAVGLWSARRRDSGRWQLPAGFLGCMAVAAIGGALAVATVEIDTAVAASLIAAGLAVALPQVPAKGSAALLAVAIAAVHGYVHGVELLQVLRPEPLLALLTASALIVGLGAMLGSALVQRSALTPALRCAGIAIAAVGGLLLGA